MRIFSTKHTAIMLFQWTSCCLIYAIVASLLARHVRAVPPTRTTKRTHVAPSVSDPNPPIQASFYQGSEQPAAESDWPSGKILDGDSSSTLADEAVEAVTKCCYRQKKYHTIGFDTSARRPIRKDIGRCRRTYLDRTVPRDPTQNPGDLVKRRRRQGPVCDQPCEDGNVCLPTRTLLERSLYANAWSPLDYEVIEGCHCVPKLHPCERKPLYKVFHHNTPYETTIDVGECRGRCFNGRDSGIDCRATKNKTETVLGPNGHECVDVITGCSCTGSCYRASHMVAFYIRKFNETTEEYYDTVQEMDVGKCLGSCTEKKGICIRRTNCAAVLLPNTYCSPKEYVPHIFQTPEGEDMTVHVINECRCI
ncbi:uncharacterized protein LOC110973668 [Acanthaster planci]|uniref:Uncharacterized protein LOC110973668 n=1 Tax=Acanthaster planci TaxID=133434 RepID=A0A8B7XJI9_ACAPL|nr:uncharacterized protein LOC110973668 [Acanthaster planci]